MNRFESSRCESSYIECGGRSTSGSRSRRTSGYMDQESAGSFRYSSLTCAQIITFIFMALLMQSCIYDAPDDRFYRTLWVSEEPPFGDSLAAMAEGNTSNGSGGRLTIEFLCGGTVSVTATGAVGTIGTYDTYGETAYFASLRLNYQSGMRGSDPIVIILEEAHRTDDLMLISWHVSGSETSYTTRLVRQKRY